MIAAGVFYSRQSAFWVRCSLFVCATYAHQKEVNFCVPFVRVCVLPSPYGCICVCVCVCVLLCACVCLVSTDIKLLVCTTSQRTTATASQQSARSQSSLVLLPLPGSFPACFYMYIYQDISGYIYICECVCNPNATWAKDGDRLPVEFVSFASFSSCFFFFLFIP